MNDNTAKPSRPARSQPQRRRRGPASAQPQAKRAPAPSHPVLAQLAAAYPTLFGETPRPLKRGIYADLLAAQGAYSRLYTAQKQLETLETEDA